MIQPINPCLGLNSVFIVNPKGCEYFFYCHLGQALEASCPGDLWFDPDSGICEKRENVLCILNIPPLKPPIILDEPIHCPSIDGSEIVFIGSNVDCGRYYICYHSRPMRQQCIADLHWNSIRNKCDYPKNAKCKVRETEWLKY